MSQSPTSRCLAYARKNIGPAGVVERWIPGAMIRKDLFGIMKTAMLAIAAGVEEPAKFAKATLERVDKATEERKS